MVLLCRVFIVKKNNMKRLIYTLLVLLVGSPLMAQTLRKPDLAFPQTVLQEAQSALKKAQKTRNGDLLVAALCQLTMADLAISADNYPKALDRLHGYQAGESRPDILALLRMLEMSLRRDYSYESPDSLLVLTIAAGEDVLRQYAIADYPLSIDPGNKEGQKYVTDLYDLAQTYGLSKEQCKMLPDTPTKFDVYRYAQTLARNHYGLSRAEVATMEDYLRRYPDGPFACEIEGLLKDYYAHRVDLTCRRQYSTARPITLSLEGKNISRVAVVAYCVVDPKNPAKKLQPPFADRQKMSFVEVARQTFTMTLDSLGRFSADVDFPALPYGYYRFAAYDEAHAHVPPTDVEAEAHPYDSYTSVSDLFAMTVSDYTKPDLHHLAVHNWTGEPLDDVTFVGGYLKRGDDCYSLYQVDRDKPEKNSPELSGQTHFGIFTDLAIYRPGEAVRWSVVCYESYLYRKQLLQGATLLVSLRDCRDNQVQCDTVTTDAMGMATGVFRLPEGAQVPLGHYMIDVRTIGQGMVGRWGANRGTHSFEVAEYKAPTFVVEFEPFATRYGKADTVRVRGSVVSIAGLPLAGQSVGLRLSGGAQEVDTLLTTDYEGRFSLERPMADLLDGAERHRYWQWFMASASVTDRGGETHEAQRGFSYVPSTEPPVEVEPLKADSCPADCPLWIADADRQLECEATAIIPLWTSVSDAYIYYIACDKDELLSQGWLHYAHPGRHELRLPMRPKGPDTEMRVTFVAHYHENTSEESVTVRLRQPKLQIETRVMRDRLVPGQTETWTLRAHYDDAQKTPAAARLMLLLYHSALAQLRANTWRFQPSSFFAGNVAHLSSANLWPAIGRTHYKWSEPVARKSIDVQLPALQTWGEGFGHPIWTNYELRTGPLLMMSKSMARTNAMQAPQIAATEEALADGVATMAEAAPLSGEANMAAYSSFVLRDSMTHVALYEPLLDTDAEGLATVTFPVPQDNATWLLEAVAYDSRLRTADLHRSIEVQRPVMVHPSLPRFVRQGDECRLLGVVQNATDDTLEATVCVEVYHPRTLQVLLRKDTRVSLAAHHEQAVGIDIQVPDTLSLMGFRIVAEAQGCSDGEQMRLPVLPAAEPITDSWVFYTDLAEGGAEAQVQHLRDSLLQVAGHPERYEFHADTSMVDYLRPQLLRVFDADATVATEIAHSIWAQSVVCQLCDTVADLSRLVDRLNALQNADGGYAWMDSPERRSSGYVTAVVVSLMDRLGELDCPTPDGLDLDRARQFLRDSTDYYRVPTRQLRRQWRQMSLADRGFAARLLYAKGKHRTARKIVRSLMEYQQTDAYYGGYWSLEHSRRPGPWCGCFWRPLIYHDQLALTAHLTEVLAEVGLPLARKKDQAPLQDAIRRARRWMMMSKRTTDWGQSSLVADAAHVLLRTDPMMADTLRPVWGALLSTRPVPAGQVQAHGLHEVRIDTVCIVSGDSFGNLSVGNRVTVAVTLTATQSLDYVTLRVPRPACLEPLRQTSGGFWQSGLWGRCETRDTETRLYVEHLTAGTHTFRFEAYVTHAGRFARPAVVLTSEYNPQFTVHSAGSTLTTR